MVILKDTKTNKKTKSSELMWIFGTIFVALGVSICSKTNLGVSMVAAPAFVIFDAIKDFSTVFSVGMIEYIFQGVLLISMCLIVRKFSWKYLLAFACAVIYGYVLNFFIWLLHGISFDEPAVQWIMLVVGDIITAFGVACFFRTYLPLQVYELFVAEVSSKYKININRVKWIFDISLFVISVTLALTLFRDKSGLNLKLLIHNSFHNIGLGTILTTVINSPIIALWSKLLAKLGDSEAKFKKMEKILRR